MPNMPDPSLAAYARSSDSILSYAELRLDINQQLQVIRGKSISMDSLSGLFLEMLLHRILPRWAGTPWSFEGHIDAPGTGSIACGYLVSTSLRHLELPINRYHLAQQSPSNEARSLALGETIYQFSGMDHASIREQMRDSLVSGIYFIGLEESHVGFLLVEESELYLIHSNYLGSGGVEMERLSASDVFGTYQAFKVVPLNTNRQLLARWKNGEPIPIFRE